MPARCLVRCPALARQTCRATVRRSISATISTWCRPDPGHGRRGYRCGGVRFRRPVIRRFRLAVPICAVLFLVSAAAPPPARALRLIARVPVGVDTSVMIEADSQGTDARTCYGHRSAHGDAGIRAYGLADGRLRWSATTVELATETTMTYLDGRVIVSMADTDSGGEHTVAFDARTGRRLWTSDLGFAVRPPSAGSARRVGAATGRLQLPGHGAGGVVSAAGCRAPARFAGTSTCRSTA